MTKKDPKPKSKPKAEVASEPAAARIVDVDAGAAVAALKPKRTRRSATIRHPLLSDDDRTPAADGDFTNPGLYLNRELSLLEFNRRVLERAQDRATPVLERLRFLTISSSNLDEFFEIRVAGLKQHIAFEIPHAGADGLDAAETLAAIAERAHSLVAEQYRLLNDDLLPALAEAGIELLVGEWSPPVARFVKRHFTAEVLPVLTPIGLDPSHPFPKVLNKSLNFIVTVEGRDAYQRASRIAVVQAPRSLPRVIEVPAEIATKAHVSYVLLSDVIAAHVGQLFRGMEVTGCYPFRVTRNSDLWVDEEEVDDLLHAVAGELPRRHYGSAVRLEVRLDCPGHLVLFLLEQFELSEVDLYKVDGPVNLNRFAAVYSLANRPDLKFRPLVPVVPRSIGRHPDLFAVLRERDVLLHHPYQSFTPVIELVRQAAHDAQVLAIKMTLYRTEPDSPLVEAMLTAARAGKEVTAVVELRARFDEATNIDLATRLQDAGAKVVYGIVGYKTHAKMTLIVRREGRRLARYVHLSTGNYHTSTAKAYTDLGLLTADRVITEDVHKIFQHLSGLGRARRLKKLLQSPFTLHKHILKLIDDETREALAGRPAVIMAKVNSLSEQEIIAALYRASQAGVTIRLIVRGICCLRPRHKGTSDRVRVRSIVDRFLEHTRVFYFFAGGAQYTYLSSADLMDRNLHRRMEVAFPIEDAELRERVIDECLAVSLADNQSAWELSANGAYKRLKAKDKKTRFRAQQVLLARYAANFDGGAPPEPDDLP